MSLVDRAISDIEQLRGDRTTSQVVAERVPPSLRPLVTISKEELAEMRANIEAWRKDPKAMFAWMADQAMVQVQILAKVAREFPGGRSGTTTGVKAIRDFAKLSAEIMDIASRTGALSSGKSEGDEHLGGDPGTGKQGQRGAVQVPKGKSKAPR